MDRKYSSEIDKKVKSLQKFFEGDRVKIKGKARITGTVVTFSSQTSIANINATTLFYGVMPDGNFGTQYYTESELTRIDVREKVSFS